MPRRLPWKTTGAAVIKRTGTPVSSRGSDEGTPVRAAASGVATPWGNATRSRGLTPARRSESTKPNTVASKLKKDRTPSTSPPPAPPEEELMRDGPENDDRYRMVEDELFAVAGSFTAHLHAAEYQRLKQKARTQNEETIRDMSRPVVGTLTEAARKRQELRRKLTRQREALRKAAAGRRSRDSDGSGDDAAELLWKGTSLHGLMTSSQKKGLPLTALTGVSATTRASKGYGSHAAGSSRGVEQRAGDARSQMGSVQDTARGVEETEDEDEDDLDRPSTGVTSNLASRARRPGPQLPVAPVAPVAPRRSNTNPSAPATRPASATAARSSTWTAATPARTGGTKRPPAAAPAEEESDGSDYDPFRRIRRRQEDGLRARREQRAARTTEKSEVKEEDLDVIPSFL